SLAPAAASRPTRSRRAGGRLAEPAGELDVQVRLIVADPGDVTVGADQNAWKVQYRRRIRDVVDPVRPAVDGHPSGAVEQQTAAAMQQSVQVAVLELDVGQATAEQVGTGAEVVADADPGDLLGQVAVHLVEVHQFGDEPA